MIKGVKNAKYAVEQDDVITKNVKFVISDQNYIKKLRTIYYLTFFVVR